MTDPADEGTVDDGTSPSPSSGADAAKEALARARSAARAAPSEPRPGGRGTTRRPGTRPAAPGHSGPGPDARDPQLLGPSVDRLLRERGWEQPAAVGGLTGRWAQIVGADVAEHVVPETFEPAPTGRGLLLVLRADSTAWATTMQYMLPAVRARIDAELGAGAVSDITILGPAAARATPTGEPRGSCWTPASHLRRAATACSRRGKAAQPCATPADISPVEAAACAALWVP
jgi:predicted nucleic acid-binding Zn ribbon protein